MIGIRADANDIVATGHIMRCITIAKQMQARGEEVCFFLADEYGISMLEENDFSYVVLDTDWEKPMGEIEVLAEQLCTKNIKKVLFDSYRMTKEYFFELRKQTKGTVAFAYIDDLFEEIYPVEVLINYNAYHSQFPYAGRYLVEETLLADGKRTRLCLGPEYVPLREEFGKTDLSEGDENTVLLSCGGGDTLQALYGILENAVRDERFANTFFHVVVGRFHQKKELLEELAQEYKRIVLHHNVSRMAELMEQNCIAVSAAGTMLYELCAMERPTVFFITADNQRYDSDFFAEDERMVFAGDLRIKRDACIDEILDGMAALLTDSQKRRVMKEKLRLVTDGRGALRIAEALEEMA